MRPLASGHRPPRSTSPVRPEQADGSPSDPGAPRRPVPYAAVPSGHSRIPSPVQTASARCSRSSTAVLSRALDAILGFYGCGARSCRTNSEDAPGPPIAFFPQRIECHKYNYCSILLVLDTFIGEALNGFSWFWTQAIVAPTNVIELRSQKKTRTIVIKRSTGPQRAADIASVAFLAGRKKRNVSYRP